MILAIPYSHKDIEQCFRLVKWIGWLSYANGHSMKKERLLLAPSRAVSGRALHREIVRLAEKVFGETTVLAPEGEHETGWPGACNYMLAQVLLAAGATKGLKEHGEDVFLLEPDAIPLCADWWDVVVSEWERTPAEVEFMGALVEFPFAHMSGNGVYGRNCLSVAPKLLGIRDDMGWDIHAADQIVPRCHFTNAIQHVWWRTRKIGFHAKYEHLNLSSLAPGAVVFHQDKHGKLIGLLDERLFGGAADQAMGYTTKFQEPIMAMNYFINNNHNRIVKAAGLALQSEPLDIMGGVWRGTFATDKENEVLALRGLAQNPKSGIRELTVEEYQDLTKKKVTNLSRSNELAPRPSPAMRAAIEPNPAAVVVEGGPSRAGQNGGQESASDLPGGPVAKDIDDVLQIGKVKLPETVKVSVKAERKGRKKK